MQHTMVGAARESDHAPIEWPEAVPSGELRHEEETAPHTSLVKLIESHPKALFEISVGGLGDENF